MSSSRTGTLPQPVVLLTPAEVAGRLRVDPKTLRRWALEYGLPCVKTLGGHRRYRETDVDAIARGEYRKGKARR